jgi:hypothetical protein
MPTPPTPQEAARPPQGLKVATRPPQAQASATSLVDAPQAIAVPARQLWTSNFATVKHLPKDIVPVSIARWPPRNWRGARCIDLAPTADALRRYRDGRMNDAEYTRLYRSRLASLDAAAILAQLPPQAALLCFCDPGALCHRYLAAQWLRAELGNPVVEFLTQVEPRRTTPVLPVPKPYHRRLAYFIRCDFCRKKTYVGKTATIATCPSCHKVNVVTG